MKEKIKKLKQIFCKHKDAVPIGPERTQLICGGMRKIGVAKYYCVRCGKEWDKELWRL